MPEPLSDLESRRSQILLEIARLGDFRRGSVHAAFRRFQQLSAELVEVNERTCQLRPPAAQDLEPASSTPKKNATRDPERRPSRSGEPAESDRQRPAQARRVRPRSLGTGDSHGPAPGRGRAAGGAAGGQMRWKAASRRKWEMEGPLAGAGQALRRASTTPEVTT